MKLSKRPSLNCISCQGIHYSHAKRLSCKRNKTQKDISIPASHLPIRPPLSEHFRSTASEAIKQQIQSLYSDIGKSRQQYYNLYNDYRRRGYGEGNYSPEKSFEEKLKARQEKIAIKDIFSQLLDLKQFQEQRNVEHVGSKDRKYKIDPPLIKTNKINSLLRSHSDKILTFEHLLHKKIVRDWDFDQKLNYIEEQSFEESDARSRLREIRGKDRQTIKTKYVLAWKILNDPLTRIMLSDRFFEAYHQKTFPKMINPFKFRRLQEDFSRDKNYFQQEAPSSLTQDFRYQELRQKFECLCKELIELKVNVYPPSLKEPLHNMITKKEKIKDKAEEQLFEMIEEADQFQTPLVVLPPASELIPIREGIIQDYWQRENRFIKEAREKKIKDKLASRRQRQWLKQYYKGHTLTQCVLQFGTCCGPSAAFSQESGADFMQTLKIDRKIRSLKEKCRRRGLKLKDIYDLEYSVEPSTVQIKKKVLELLQKRLVFEDFLPGELRIRSIKAELKRKDLLLRYKPISKRTLYSKYFCVPLRNNYANSPKTQEKLRSLSEINLLETLNQGKENFNKQEVLVDPEKQLVDKGQMRPQSLSRAAKTKCLKQLKLNRIKLSIREPRCPDCRSMLKWEFKRIYCSNCPFEQLAIDNETTNKSSKNIVLRMETNGPLFDLSLKLPEFEHSTNSISQQMEGKWGSSNIYLPSCPETGFCNYTDFSPIEKLIDSFRKNILRLPLQIKTSTISNAGKGIFATKKLLPETLIGVYSGLVGTHLDSNANSDSLFELGWFKSGTKWFPLVVDGLFSNDGTRFVNSKPSEKANVKAIIGIVRQELTIIYIINQIVQENEELFVNYGRNYSL